MTPSLLAGVRVLELELPFGALSEEQRRSRCDEIDRAIARGTGSRSVAELAARLQAAGVVAAVVADALDLVDDPQLEHLGFWVELDHREVPHFRARSGCGLS